MIKAVVIEGQSEIRDKITSILSAREDFQVVAHGKDAYDALRLTGSLKPDIAILDNQLKYIDGEEIPPLLRARSPSTAVVILTAKTSDFQLYKAVSNEVSGLVHKEADIDSLPSILKCISEGGCFISPSLAARVLHLFAGVKWKNVDIRFTLPNNARVKKRQKKVLAGEDPARHLSKTELQILTCVGEGNTSDEIAQNLHLAVGTVRNYISAVMHKTGLHSRPQLVRYALKYGLVPPAWL